MPRLTFRPAKILVGVVALIAAYFAWVDAGATVLYRINPGFVLSIEPGDPRSLSAAVDRRTLAERLTQPSSDEVRQLREALQERPLSASILRQLAVADEVEGRTPKAARLLDLAHRVSRRDLLTQLLLSNLAVRSGRPDAAMRHFAAVLSAKPAASSLLFPPLTETVREERFQPVIARYLDWEWGPAFLDYAVRHADPADLLATVLQNGQVQREDRFRRFRGDLIVSLVNAQRPGLAFDYAGKLAERESAPIKVAGFTAETIDPGLGPLLWRLSNTNGIYASLAGPAVVVDIEPASTGVAVERIFALREGTYVMSVTGKATDLIANLAGEWLVECADKGKKVLGRLETGFASEAQRVRLPIRVDQTCEAIRVSLSLRNLDDQAAGEVELSNFELMMEGS
jgi:hypothetical protein